ncbi:hypothetical protein TYRP_006270 [Tyrophagus putrescentiae]|nr:hypothetical protein TYRP_006270 [Tyrophagus putrescentiae]
MQDAAARGARSVRWSESGSRPVARSRANFGKIEKLELAANMIATAIGSRACSRQCLRRVYWVKCRESFGTADAIVGSIFPAIEDHVVVKLEGVDHQATRSGKAVQLLVI